MRKKSRAGGFLAVIALSGLASACPGCDDSNSPVPTTPSEPTVSSVEIGGPGSIAPGQSAQFTATVRLSNGTSKLATSATVRWRTSSSLLQVSPSGLATAGQLRGDVVLTAEVPAVPASGTRRSTREIVVLPDGTYRLVGLVSDVESPPTTPLAGARVEVAGGPPLFAITGSDGRYRLYGVPPDADVQVTRSGYRPLVQSVQLTAHATQNFSLALSGPRLSLAGPYTLTVDVVDGCPGSRPLPADLQRRTYQGVLTQNGATAEVTLTEPRFNLNGIGGGNKFSGRVDAAGAAFTLQPYSDYYYSYYGPTAYPNVAERLANGTVLEVSGTAVVTGSQAGLTGTMNGWLHNWGPRFPTIGDWLGGCSSTGHRFTLSPR